jgi:hypothetical protein
MQKNINKKDLQTMTIAVIIVFSFVILSTIAAIPWESLSDSQSHSNVYAGTQETVDVTPTPIATTAPLITTAPVASPTQLAVEVTPFPTFEPAVTPTPFDFGGEFGGNTDPQLTPTPLPTFNLNLPGEGNTDPLPTATQASAVVQNNNTPLIIIGVIVGVVILLAIVGFILLKKSRDNTPPPTFPGNNSNFNPNSTNSTTDPQYPPYINQ